MQDDSHRDKSVKTAGCSKVLTLMTSEYARGTDFVLNNQQTK